MTFFLKKRVEEELVLLELVDDDDVEELQLDVQCSGVLLYICDL